MPIVDCGFAGDRQFLVDAGPTLPVQIGFDPTFRAGQDRPPALQDIRFTALIDSGARESCIDNDLALRLGLPIVDRARVSGVQGRFETNVYLAQICVPDLAFTIHGRFSGVMLRQGGQPHFALLGREFLRNFYMVYNGQTGSVILTREDPNG